MRRETHEPDEADPALLVDAELDLRGLLSARRRAIDLIRGILAVERGTGVFAVEGSVGRFEDGRQLLGAGGDGG